MIVSTNFSATIREESFMFKTKILKKTLHVYTHSRLAVGFRHFKAYKKIKKRAQD